MDNERDLSNISAALPRSSVWRLKGVLCAWFLSLMLGFTQIPTAHGQAYVHGGSGHHWTPESGQALWQLGGNIAHEFTHDWGAGYAWGVGQQWYGFGSAAYTIGDLAYGGLQIASVGVGSVADVATGGRIPAAKLRLPNPGPSWESPGLASFDHSCKMNGYEATYRQHAWNTVTFGIPALIAGVAEDFDKGTNNTMQALGGFFFGSALGPAVGAGLRPLGAFLGPIAGRIPQLIRPQFQFPKEFAPMFQTWKNLPKNPKFYRITESQYLFQDANGHWWAKPNTNSCARIRKPGSRSPENARGIPGLNVTVSEGSLYGPHRGAVQIEFTLLDLLGENPNAQFYFDQGAINPNALYIGALSKPVRVNVLPVR